MYKKKILIRSINSAKNAEITAINTTNMQLIRVGLDVPLSTLFDYVVEQNAGIKIGQRVRVPFGRKEVIGVVLELPQYTDVEPERLKPAQLVDDTPPLPQDILALLYFCSDYYRHPLGMTVMSALPARLRNAEPCRIERQMFYRLTALGQDKTQADLPKRKVVQGRILAALKSGPCTPIQLRALSATVPANLKAMQEAGWIELVEEENAATQQTRFEGGHSLTAEQQQVVNEVAETSGYRCFLLHGITGSGKTETYVHLMHESLQRGGQVLLLIPEINLTPQLEQYFRNRFPDTELVSLHSGLNDGVRAQNWLRAQSGAARIVLGTRLAVFAPMPHLSLILVDEEHDASFKQQDGLRYSARDVAIFRASQRGVPVVLGSATPSLESWHNAQSGRYELLKLTQRAAAQAELPQIRCIDISRTPLQEGLSTAVLAAIRERLGRKEQSLLFINRRGYAPVLMCTACGWLSGCPNCSGKLVLHLKDRRLRCHHCGYQNRVPTACPSCGNADLHPVGLGTQRLEAALQQHFPEARILRVDRDSTRNKGAWNAMREQIHAGEADILVGTQILAKGHDFPNLTLVAVLDPDGALYSADFRASERLFAQLVQVAGRAGRADKPGEVLVQTAFPEHPLFAALRRHDFEAWAQQVLAERDQAGFPPFVYQAMLRAEGRQDGQVFAFLKRAREAAIELAGQVEVYGVVPASMPKRAQRSRAQLLIQASSRKALQQFLRAWQPQLETLQDKKIRWSLDVDPIEF